MVRHEHVDGVTNPVQPWHILNVSLKHIIGGTPQVCLDYSNALKMQNVNVTALIRKKDPFAAQHKNFGANVSLAKFAGKFGSYDPFALLYCKYLLAKIKPDAIIAHDGRGVKLFTIASKGKIPIIDVNHGRSIRQSAGTDGTIVINSMQLTRARNELSHNKIIEFIPNMVDIPDKEITIKPWHNPPIIGAMGRFVDEKAFDVLLDALAILKSKNIIFEAIIGGDGANMQAIAQQLKNNKLEEQVQLCGWVNNPTEFYNNIDIFCLSSRSEACPKVLLEAMKHGLPVVTTDAEGACDIVTNEYDGLVAMKNNPAALATALEKMLQDYNAAQNYAKNARTTIINNYSVVVVGKKLFNMLSKVVKEQ